MSAKQDPWDTPQDKMMYFWYVIGTIIAGLAGLNLIKWLWILLLL